jgi:hypothetical protein
VEKKKPAIGVAGFKTLRRLSFHGDRPLLKKRTSNNDIIFRIMHVFSRFLTYFEKEKVRQSRYRGVAFGGEKIVTRVM